MKKGMRSVLLAAIVLATALLAGCSSRPEAASIVIEDPWARPGQMRMAGAGNTMASAGEMGGMAGTSAIFMTIRNQGREDDRLIGVSGDVAQFVELHTTETRNGVSMMAQIPGIDVPGGKEVVLGRGGLHIMLIDLKRSLDQGDTVTVELQFEKSGSQTVTATVRAP